jgi:hypothetical protein
MGPGQGITDRGRICPGDREDHGDELVLFYDDLVVVYFDDAGTVVGDHLVVYFIHYAFIQEPGEIVDFIELKGVESVTGFVDALNSDIQGRVGPVRKNVAVKHDIGFSSSN